MATPWLRRFTGPLLPPAWREASVEERLRGSLFVVGCLAMASVHVGLAAVLWVSLGLTLVVGAVAAGAAAMIVAVALFRWTGSLRGPGVLVLATMISALTAVAAHTDGSLVLWTPWWAVFPPLATYLIGRRAGWAVAGVVLVDMALLGAAHAQGLTLPGGALGDREVVPVSWLAHGSGVFAVAILVALYDRLRDEAREELQDALHWARDSERRLATLVHQTDDMICALDDGLRITAVNRAFLELLGIVVDPVVGKRLIDVLPPGDRRRWGERFARALRGSSERVVDSHGMGGDRSHVEMAITPVCAGGAVHGVILHGRDVTERIEADARLREESEHLLELSRRAGRAETQAAVLHGVGNALNSVNVAVEAAQEQARDLPVDRLVRLADLLEGNADHLGDFCAQDERGAQVPAYLRTLSRRLDTGRTGILEQVERAIRHLGHTRQVVSAQDDGPDTGGVIQDTDLVETLETAIRFHQPLMERDGIDLVRDLYGLPTVRIDRHRLMQIVMSLLHNAREAVQDVADARIEVSSRNLGGSVLIRVEDNGCGIPSEDMDQLFQPGFTTKGKVGMGLHATALGVEELGGEIEVHSAGEGRGATFEVRVPVKPPGEDRPPTAVQLA